MLLNYGKIEFFSIVCYNTTHDRRMKRMPSTLAKIKLMLDSHIGKSLTVTSHVGRKKVMKCTGTLQETFPAIFVVELDQGESAVERVSYSYTDVLTKNIKLEFEGEESADTTDENELDESELDDEIEEF